MMTYDIRDHVTVLTPSKVAKTKYHCPVCNGRNLDIHPQTGVYKCFTSECLPKDIRAAIDKLEGKPEWKPEQDDWVKPIRTKSEQDYFYPDRDRKVLIKVVRKDDGEGKKEFPQYHWTGSSWKIGNPQDIRHRIPIYRYTEVRQAIERNELIFWVEGEATADRLWAVGIPATTTLGGSGGYGSYGNYQDDLKGARLVLAPDRDSNGLKYIANIERDFSNQIDGYYLAGTQALWKSPHGGMDIGDDLQDWELDKEQILAKVITPESYSQIGKLEKLVGNPVIDIRQQLEDLVHTDLENSEVKIRLTQLAKDRKASVCGLEKILKEIEAEADRDELRPELKIEIDRLTTAKSTFVDIHKILPPTLAKPIEMLAKSLGHNVEPYLLYLLAGTGGVLHSESFIQLRTGYQQPGNLYGGVIADSGSMKSPVQKQMLTKPLAKLQREYNERHAQEWAQYEIDAENWKPDSGEPKPTAPHHHVVYTNNMTMEAMDIIAAKQPQQSAIYIKDELKAIFMTANQYRQGDDIQTYLSRYDGEQLNRIRTGSGFVSSDHEIKFTMVGTIQPGVIAKLSDNQDDDDGLMSRFLFSNLNCRFVPMSESIGVDIVDLIADIYSKVHKLPATTYKLNSDAFKKFAVEFDRLRLNSLDTSREGWERNVWSKAGGQLGRLILNLHLIWSVNDFNYRRGGCPHVPTCAENGDTQGEKLSPNVSPLSPHFVNVSPLSQSIDKIQPETVEKAIELIRYFVDQAIGLIADQSGELSPKLARILSLARKKGVITPRDIVKSTNVKHRSINTKQALDSLKELAAMQYGSLEKQGRRYVFSPSGDFGDKVGTQVGTPQTHTNQEIQPKWGLGDTLTPLSPHDQFSENIDPKPPLVDRPTPSTLGQPKPPVVDRSIPETVTVNDFIKYQIVDDRVKYLELAFHKHSVAKEWQSQIELWGGNTGRPHQITRNGKKWLLCVSDLAVARLEQILACNIGQPPQQPSRR